MSTDKTIFVTGATGNQGGAIVRNLLRHRFNVKALTRNKDSSAAQLLKQKNVDLIQGTWMILPLTLTI